MDHLKVLQRMEEVFGSRLEHLIWQLTFYAVHPEAQFDITFYDREPILGASLDAKYARAFRQLKPSGGKNLKTLCERIVLSDGTVTDSSKIWTLNYMPDDLDAAAVTDLSPGEQVIGAGNETVREIIRDTYRCKSHAEEDYFLRRWIAS
jgi:hypothetical protein